MSQIICLQCGFEHDQPYCPKCGEPLIPNDHLHTASPTLPPNAPAPEPRIVCLCGSSKWPALHMRVMMDETLAGRIVIPMGLYGHADFPSGAKAATCDGDELTAVKQMLDRLHHAKIDASDEILVVRVDGYIGSSTAREIQHAKDSGKPVRFADFTEAETNCTPLPASGDETGEVSEDEIRAAVEADFNQLMIDSLTPDRGYLTPIDHVRALIEKAVTAAMRAQKEGR